MAKSRFLLLASLAVCAAASTQAQANSAFSTQVSAIVPTICKVAHGGDVTDLGGSFGLGQITEYCNAPGGFSLYVDYAPGTLVGTKLLVGQNTIELDGSGHAAITEHQGPKIVTSDITVTPGKNGFDSGFLTFGVDPH